MTYLFNEWIRSKGQSVNALAETTGIKRGIMGPWAIGMNIPSAASLKKLAKALGASKIERVAILHLPNGDIVKFEDGNLS